MSLTIWYYVIYHYTICHWVIYISYLYTYKQMLWLYHIYHWYSCFASFPRVHFRVSAIELFFFGESHGAIWCSSINITETHKNHKTWMPLTQYVVKRSHLTWFACWDSQSPFIDGCSFPVTKCSEQIRPNLNIHNTPNIPHKFRTTLENM